MVTPNCVITDAGREIMRRITTSGLTVKSAAFAFTKVAFGNGEYTEEERTESYLRSATTLKSQKNTYPVTSLKKVSARDPQNMLYKASTIAYNYNIATETVLVSNGYYITEIGIYAKATGGTETLVAIALIGDTVDTSENDYMPGVDPEEEIEGQIYQIVYDLYFGYSNVELDATIESSGAAYSMEDGQALEALISPGEGTGSVVIKNTFNDDGMPTASGYGALAGGWHAEASGASAIALGFYSLASGNYSFACIDGNAYGNYSVAIGSACTARGDYSVAIGRGVFARSQNQAVFGRYNVTDSNGKYAFIIGNGTGEDAYSNAYALTWDGDAHYALNTAAASGTVDGDLYAAITALGWESEVIV